MTCGVVWILKLWFVKCWHVDVCWKFEVWNFEMLLCVVCCNDILKLRFVLHNKHEMSKLWNVEVVIVCFMFVLKFWILKFIIVICVCLKLRILKLYMLKLWMLNSCVLFFSRFFEVSKNMLCMRLFCFRRNNKQIMLDCCVVEVWDSENLNILILGLWLLTLCVFVLKKNVCFECCTC